MVPHVPADDLRKAYERRTWAFDRQTTALVSVPQPSTSIFITYPVLRNSPRGKPTPEGVPGDELGDVLAFLRCNVDHYGLYADLYQV